MGAATTPLRVNIADLLHRVGATRDVAVSVTVEELDLAGERLDGAAVVTLDAHLRSMPDGVVVSGHLRVPWHGTCRRCITRIEGVAEIEVSELFQDHPIDPELFVRHGEQIDLTEMVREHVIGDVPAIPLCRDECAGLCPRCGVDRNTHTCDCVVEVRDDRWAVLDTLRDVGE